MSELEVRLRRILESMIVEAPAGEAGRVEGLARFRRQGLLLVEKARAQSGDVAAHRLHEIVERLIAEHEPDEMSGDEPAPEAHEASDPFMAPEAGMESRDDVPPEMKRREGFPPPRPSGRAARIRHRLPAIPTVGDRRSFAAGFGLATLVALFCAGLAWAVLTPATSDLSIPHSDIVTALPVLEEVRQAMGEVVARIEAGLPADNPALENSSRFVGMAGAFPEVYRTLSPDARRSGNLIMRVDDGGYKILSQGRLCPLAAQKYPDMIDRWREGDVSRLCLSFGYWNDGGKAF